MSTLKPPRAARLSALALLLLAACKPGDIKLTTTTVAAGTRGTEWSFHAQNQGTVGSASCNPASPVPPSDVNGWWAGIDPGTTSRVVVTGFQLWSHTAPGCGTTRQDFYRGLFAYDLSTIAALGTAADPIAPRISSAKLRLEVQGGLQSSAPAPGLTCRANLGGVHTFAVVRPGGIVKTGLRQVGILQVAGTPPEEFTPVSPSEDLSAVPVPGTVGKVTANVGGGGVTIYEIDVRDLLIGALNRGDGTLSFALLSDAEAPAAWTGDIQAECRTFSTPGDLVVQSL